MHFCRPIPPTLLFHLEHEEGKLGTRSHPFCFESETLVILVLVQVRVTRDRLVPLA